MRNLNDLGEQKRLSFQLVYQPLNRLDDVIDSGFVWHFHRLLPSACLKHLWSFIGVIERIPDRRRLYGIHLRRVSLDGKSIRPRLGGGRSLRLGVGHSGLSDCVSVRHAKSDLGGADGTSGHAWRW